MYLVVKSLLSLKERISKLAERVRERSLKRQETRLTFASERIDVEDELFVKRVKMAESIRQMMEDRAVDKLVDGHAKANADKKAAGDAINKLKEL